MYRQITGRYIGQVSVKYRPIIGEVSAKCRPNVGQVSAKCLRGIGDLKAISADIHIDRLSTDYRPTIHRVSTECRSTVDRVSIDSRSSVDRVSTATSTDIAVDSTYSKHDPIFQCLISHQDGEVENYSIKNSRAKCFGKISCINFVKRPYIIFRNEIISQCPQQRNHCLPTQSVNAERL